MKLQVTEETELMVFLLLKLTHHSRTNIKSLLRDGQIHVDGRIVTQHNYRLIGGQTIEISQKKSSKPAQCPTGIRILFEDAYLIIVEKEERYKLVQLLKTVDSRRISNISNYQNYQRYYTYYKNAKIVIGALFLFFGKQILSHPNFYKIILFLIIYFL